jgi:hypothetical protein
LQCNNKIYKAMSLITCPECQKEISSSAENCPNCGFPLAKAIEAEVVPKRKIRKGYIIILLFIISTLFVAVTLCNRNDSGSYSSSMSLSQDERKMINDLINQELLKIDYKNNSAYVESLIWLTFDAKSAEEFTQALAIFCADKKGTKSYFVKILDMETGNKLAEYSQNRGFKLY